MSRRRQELLDSVGAGAHSGDLDRLYRRLLHNSFFWLETHNYRHYSFLLRDVQEKKKCIY